MAVAGHRGRVSLCLRRRHRGTERGVGDGRGPVCVCVCVCVWDVHDFMWSFTLNPLCVG